MDETIRGLEVKKGFLIEEIEDVRIKSKAQEKGKYAELICTNDSIPLIPPTLSQHILFTGGIGTGKTNAIMQLTYQYIKKMSKNDTIIIFDSKGDFYDTFFYNAEKINPNIKSYCIANDGRSNVTWNIFKEAVSGLSNNATKSEINDALYEVSSLLFQPIIEKDKNNPFFTMAAKNIFYGILKVLSEKKYIKTRNPDSVTNRMIYDFSQKPVQEIVMEFSAKEHKGELVQLIDYLGRVDANGNFRFNDQGASVLATLRNFMLEIFKGKFVEDGNFSIRNTISQSGEKLIFIEYDISQGTLLGPIYKTILDFAIKETLRQKRGKRSVFFVIDEFRLVPKLEYMDSGVNLGRSLGAKFTVGIQNILQIDTVYERGLARSILSGFTTSVNFRTTDPDTREYIKGLFGKRVYIYDNISLSGGVTREHDDVVSDHDILTLNRGQAILSIPILNKNPIIITLKDVKECFQDLKVRI